MKFERYIPNDNMYRLKQGETIKQVADKFNTSIDNIEILSSTLEGDFVKIKKCNHTTHVVKPLETLCDIAKIYGVSETYIIENNNLKTKRLFIGQKLRF